jgi:hypothetical protein
MLAEDTFQAINGPVEVGRQRASGLRFADQRVHALWQAMILFRQLPEGFRAAVGIPRKPDADSDLKSDGIPI